jgi:hypothetical protein
MTQEDCTGGSLTWLNDACYGVYSGEDSSCNADGDICAWWLLYMEDDKWAKLVDDAGTYDVDPVAFYNNAYDCKKNNPDGDGAIDTGSLPYDGTMPGCFYKMDVKKGTYDTRLGIFSEVDL